MGGVAQGVAQPPPVHPPGAAEGNGAMHLAQRGEAPPGLVAIDPGDVADAGSAQRPAVERVDHRFLQGGHLVLAGGNDQGAGHGVPGVDFTIGGKPAHPLARR